MNAGKQPLMVLNQECNCTVTQATNFLNSAGYSVVKSFDLISAASNQAICNCQMVVLLVYEHDGPPTTLIFDGAELHTSIFLENGPERSSRSRLISFLSKIIEVDGAEKCTPDQSVGVIPIS